jgi:hypothetical protein
VRDCARCLAFNALGPDRRRPSNPVRSKEAAVRGALWVRRGGLVRSQTPGVSRTEPFKTVAHAWARSLSRAVCFPTPLSAAKRMFRSHGGTVLTVTGRDLSSEASAPSSDTPCREWHAGRGADTSAI